MRMVFFGSDDFAAAHLQTLLDWNYDVAACVTPPRKPKGRGMAISLSPVEILAEAVGVPVLRPPDLRSADVTIGLTNLRVDLFVVIAYGRLLPQAVLDIPRRGSINVHGSLLPSYRGAAPINWAILNGERETGVSVIQMSARMDAGDILGQARVAIDPDETAITLRQKMIVAGQRLLPQMIVSIDQGKAVPVVQDETLATLAPKLTKSLGRIDWKDTAQNIYNKIRGLQPWPGAYIDYQGQPLKIVAARVEPDSVAGQPGEWVDTGEAGLRVATGQGVLLVEQVHPAGGKVMDALSFVNGQRISKGFVF